MNFTNGIALDGPAGAGKSSIAKRAAKNALSSVMRSGTSAIIRGLLGNKK